ncbi:tRNA (adenosine(37)-N6)-dimethylallyltransferase MiaA [Sphaerotilus sp.]|uniref:tRNA (adenosine(37)-N6)-dimethylallyltransferase MiaA n=1 Tax=Sphaerotilus sp. TaxID=2093942 RepID=UPI002ACE2430|nr:tRNA (adenosine(37)-N6)-dimethylallyltransferase MiaA [Sphaerotilus sp.]MDZ7856433.1 tRNA (adenosine(37)-N6)-dimethylallyltransferase MiaA [Sphaerotilus sp.]
MTAPTTFALAGPTASGKTAAALAIARACRARGLPPVEIISVDSALVYRGMDIGTAKPSAAERAEVPHHLVDVIEPTDAYSAAEFVRDTRRLIDDIHARGARALLVGGTMLYFKALFDGIDALPVADPAVRAALDERARAIGWPAMHALLAAIDPVTAARLSPNDAQRIQRALEVWQVSGQPLSSFHTGRFERAAATPDAAPEFPLLSLEPTDRAWLHARVAQRFEAMLEQGLIAEVQRLRARGDLHPALPSMRCVGYRQTWEMLDGLWPAVQLPEKGIAATRQLAKRQITWLRSMAQREVIACDVGDPVGAVLARVMPVLEREAP